MKPVKPTKNVTLRDGSRVVEYPRGDMLWRYTMPPPGFRPESASNAALDQFGFPARPSDPVARASWTAMMKQYRRTAEPGTCVGGAAHTTYVNCFTTRCSDIWGGVVNTGSSTTFIGTQASFNVPVVNANCPSAGSVTEWVGLGGYGSGNALLQAGVDAQGPWGQYAWFEYIDKAGNDPYGPQVMPGISFGTGDTIYAHVWYDTVKDWAHFFLLNQTNGTATPNGSITKALGQSTWYSGASSEFIMESYGGTETSQFGPIHFTGAQSQKVNGSWYGAHTIPFDTVYLVDIQGSGAAQVRAAPQPFTSTSNFDIHWLQCY